MEAVDVRGRFVWHQLMTRDVTGAKNFYSKLVGWKTMPWPLDPAYTVCHADVGPVAGIMAIPSEFPADIPSHWLQYIGTRDVDGTADAAVRAGGSVMKSPSDMQGAGRYAVIKDPQGAVFAIIDPENARPESQGPPPLGTFSWHELATTDHEAAFAFYSGLFGWDVMQRMDMGTHGVYLIFGQKGVHRGGMYIPSSNLQVPPSWMPYAFVPDADEAYALSLSIGAKSLVAPMEVPGGSRIACLLDPAGAAFSVNSMPAAAAGEAVAAKPKAQVKAKPKAKPAKPATRSKAAKPAAKAKAKTKTKAKAKTTSKTKAKTTPKTKRKAKVAKKKPAARKKVARKVAKKAKRAAPRRKAVTRKKSGARRKK
jgi:predicted enzyme related to lactoylglutathione lyase